MRPEMMQSLSIQGNTSPSAQLETPGQALPTSTAAFRTDPHTHTCGAEF